MNQAATQEQVKKFTIKVQEPTPFPDLLKGGVITSRELMDKISDLFSAAYKDYQGCVVFPRANGIGYDVKLYFSTPSVDNDGASYAFELTNDPMRQQKSRGIISGLASIEKRASQRMFRLTQHGEEGLIDFFSFDRNKKFDMNQFIFEESQNSNINSGVFAVVTNLDINKLLAAIYGSEENGERLQYQLTTVRAAEQNPYLPPASMNWILYVNRLSVKELNKMANKMGIIQTNGIYMVGRH